MKVTLAKTGIKTFKKLSLQVFLRCGTMHWLGGSRMNYDVQRKLFKDALIKFPKFKKQMINFRKCWMLGVFKYTTVTVKGILISDHVILTTNLENDNLA